IYVMPTLMHLLGIYARDYIVFGTYMFSEKHNDVIAFRNGDFFTEDYAKVKGLYYDNHTGEEIEEPDEELQEINSQVIHELQLSDKLLQGDLLRFYSPTESWEPVDPTDYFYDENQLYIHPDLIEKWLGVEEDDVDGINVEEELEDVANVINIAQ